MRPRSERSKDQIKLFDLPPPSKLPTYFKKLTQPFWTENKAKLVARYLYYFVLITRHGAYIDGFAGPQKPDKPEMWAAKLVLESEPRWLRNFFLFEKDRNQYKHLCDLKNSQPPGVNRKIHLYHKDFNSAIESFLRGNPIGEKEASFCLLDQRTFECHWSTVVELANYKTQGMKIELFYFLSASWFDRAMYASKNEGLLRAFWGREDWEILRGLKSLDRAVLFCNRIKNEFRYHSVTPWPIFDRKDGGRIMYHMIHASDHPLAPNLMHRAYHKAVQPEESMEQLRLDFEKWKSSR